LIPTRAKPLTPDPHAPNEAARTLVRPWRIAGWIGVALLVIVSLMPDPPTLTALEGEDKIGHVLAYAGLMLWFAQIHLARAARWRVALGLVALGVALEFAQGWTGERTFSYADMSADVLGVVLGWLAAPPRGPSLMLGVARMWSLRTDGRG
jgi:VanZ family protein